MIVTNASKVGAAGVTMTNEVSCK